MRIALIIGAATAALSLFPAKSTHAHSNMFNPFIQPNDSTLVAYGSGDANKDGKIDIEDYNTIKLMLGKKTTEDSREFDRADVDGDGIITQADADLVLKYINKEIPYLPGHWNKLKTQQERWYWLQNCLTIDWTRKTKWNGSSWLGNDFKTQMFINFTGINPNEQDSTFSSKYILKDNCRFNIPMYGIDMPKHPRYDDYRFNIFYDISEAPFSFYRAINIVVIGDNSQKWESLRFIEPQDPLFNLNTSEIGIYVDLYMHHITSLSKTQGDKAILLSKFKLDKSGTISTEYTNPNLVLTRPIITSVEENKNRPIPFPTPSLAQNYPNPSNGSIIIEYSVPKSEKVSLEVFNMQGQKLETLVNNETQTAGKHRASFKSGKYASGLYFYKLNAEDKDSKPYTETKKILIVK